MFRNKIIYNKFVASILILLLTNISLSSCYSLKESGKVDDGIEKYYRVVLIDGTVIDFEETVLGYAFRSGDKIVSINKKGENIEIPLSKVKRNYTKKIDYGKSVLLGTGVVIGIGLVLIGIIIIGMDGRSLGG